MRIRTRTRHSGTFALLLLAQACAGGQTGDESTTHKPMTDGGAAHGDILDQLVHQTPSFNYMPATSLKELVSRSEQIATGTITAIRPGPIDTSFGGSDPSHTVLMQVRVAKTLLGEPSSALYIDFRANDAEAPISGPAPEGRVLVFLGQAYFDDGRIVDAGDSVPAGEVLYALTTPQGFWIETESGAQEVFERSDASWHTPQMSFDDMVRAVEDLVPSD